MNLYDLIINDKEEVSIDHIYFSPENQKALTQVIKEQKFSEALSKYNLPLTNKILLYGHTGCGKTTTAKALATALDKPIIIIDLSTLISSRIGETSKNIKSLFDKAKRDKAVLFLDEFDQIGKMRGQDDKDVGEMRRLVNTLIQLIDYLSNDSVLICATNTYDLIDTALLRRFQIKLKFELPSSEELDVYYTNLLSIFPEHLRNITRFYGISYAEAKDHVQTSLKSLLIEALEQELKMA